MSRLLQLIRPQGIKRGLTFLKPKETNIYIKINKSDSVAKSTDKYEVKGTWVSYGYYCDDKKKDRQALHLTFFFSISITLVLSFLILGNTPDPFLKDWAQREAYLQLRYREEHGLPPIDPNLIDPSKIKLPTEEELGYTEIII